MTSGLETRPAPARGWDRRRIVYDDYYVYDNIVHSVSPVFYSPVLYIALVRLGGHGAAVFGWRRRLEGLPGAVKGAVGMAAGVLLLVWPSPALRTVEIVFGVAVLVHAMLAAIGLYLLVLGALRIIQALEARRSRADDDG